MNENTITINQLRSILFLVEDQGMTVKELRRELFKLDAPNTPLTHEEMRQALRVLALNVEA